MQGKKDVRMVVLKTPLQVLTVQEEKHEHFLLFKIGRP